MCRYLLTACSVIGLAALPALGQLYDAPANPTVSDQSMLWEWLFGLTFLVGCLVVGFKPSKRSNLQ